ncbi:hypothetical protein BX600DRAFT_482032 [Xylariales sp. PMI_506]|nr:hypothetical protein BX600DRAFT_482032 [Xylariales sp. PMI_506]
MVAIVDIPLVAVSLLGLATQPIFPISALAVLAYGPAPLLDYVRGLLGLGIARYINGALNRWATNNWSIRPHSDWQWPNEIAVVTGGCNGIGKAIVQALVRRSIKVAILDIEILPADLSGVETVSYWKCDITSTREIHEVANQIRKTLGNPSILINNAGIAHFHSIIDAPEERVKRVLGVNLGALWSTTKEFLPSMITRNKGHIVTVASVASFIGMAKTVDYCASKAGALAFHEGLGSEIKHVYKSPGVMTTVVHPMWVRTAMTESGSESIEKSSGKMLTADHVAEIIVRQVQSQRGSQVIIPSSWPNWIQESVRDDVANYF